MSPEYRPVNAKGNDSRPMRIMLVFSYQTRNGGSKMLQQKIALLAASPKNIGLLCELIGNMPNIDMKTKGGHVFWDNMAVSNGWKIQKNKLTNHCRILDPQDVRRAWGSESIMMNALDRLQSLTSQAAATSGPSPSPQANSSGTLVFCPSCGSQVPDGNFCKQCGANMN